ncbi:MAG: hypothetical protein VKJ85_14850 [Prochlorothrix sp.]|nr:hypothetical protein [Prochlorothrix sp.]
MSQYQYRNIVELLVEQEVDLCTGQNPGNTYYTRVLGDQPQMLSLQGFGAMLITFLSGT